MTKAGRLALTVLALHTPNQTVAEAQAIDLTYATLRSPEGVSSLGHLSASLLSYSPFRMLLRRSTDIYPKEPARDRREFFNSLLGACQLF
jgi:hypothetical protein